MNTNGTNGTSSPYGRATKKHTPREEVDMRPVEGIGSLSEDPFLDAEIVDRGLSSPQMTRPLIRISVRSFYSIQKVRILTGNRLAANFRARIGLSSNQKEEEVEEAADLLKEIRLAYRSITEGIVHLRGNNFRPDDQGIITNLAEAKAIKAYLDLEANEKKQQQAIEEELLNHAIWTNWLINVKGCGPIMSAILISELDIREADYVSSFWKIAGYDVGPDGRGRGKYQEHLIDHVYVDANGETQTRKGITFNSFLKTKLYVLGCSFLRSKSPYADDYRNYKHRLETVHPRMNVANDKVINPDTGRPIASKAHRHSMAMRYMVKMFLRDLWTEWRQLEGLPVSGTYDEVHNQHEHGAGPGPDGSRRNRPS